MAKPDWKDEHIETLRELVKDPALSNKDIADRINERHGTALTRNAVIGKISRLHLVKEKSINSPRGGERAVPHGGRKPRALQEEGALYIPPFLPGHGQGRRIVVVGKSNPDKEYALGRPVALEELNSATCHWPLGTMQERPPYMYCGNPVMGLDKPYCAGHYHLSLDRARTARTRIRPSWRATR